MKKTFYILLILPTIISAQLHLNAGVVDIQDRLDGNTLSWDVGHTEFIGKIGVGANFRSTMVKNDSYFTTELNIKYRIEERNYRLDVGPGIGYNIEHQAIYPLITIRNSFKVGEDTWINVDFDNAYRGGFETYLMVGFGLDINWLRCLCKP
ncbi:hypothetical protein [Muricauda sp. MAR_2010_75]|uniref:hypothetical protein n=1 Tax=Allomuricauda sp. MAR_2010_75 TaxID=1250232 RepID=UPI0005664742|nr:hypothetical protein [Muricauda sp. MAR_2010_75]